VVFSFLLEDYRLIVERFASPNDPESYAAGKNCMYHTLNIQQMMEICGKRLLMHYNS
jgi:hypothetical protein